MAVKIPLRRRDGAVRAYALVDQADSDWLGGHSWHLNDQGYAITTIRGRKVRMARLILGLEPGDPLQADHVNGDRLDNRRANLRAATHAENQHNRHRPNRRGSSSFRGVSITRRGLWRAQVRLAGRAWYLGEHETQEAAARVAAAFRAKHMPFSREVL